MTPQELYHYTSIQTLALILKYQTIRLNRLDLVDDLEEAQTSDYGTLGRFCFVSCWTDNAEESIPLWKMYSNDMQGVRIKLPVFPFVNYKYSSQRGKWDGYTYTVSTLNEYPDFSSCINRTKLEQLGVSTALVGQEKTLTKVIYTNDETLILPKVFTHEETEDKVNTKIEIGVLGKYKRTVWAFQDEWRYKLFISPFAFDASIRDPQFIDPLYVMQLFRTSALPFPFFDMDIDQGAFEQMEITLGPKVSDAEEVIIQSLVNQYNPSAKIHKSTLKIR